MALALKNALGAIEDMDVEKLNKVFEENGRRFATLEGELDDFEESLLIADQQEDEEDDDEDDELGGESGYDGDDEDSDNVDDVDNSDDSDDNNDNNDVSI